MNHIASSADRSWAMRTSRKWHPRRRRRCRWYFVEMSRKVDCNGTIARQRAARTPAGIDETPYPRICCCRNPRRWKDRCSNLSRERNKKKGVWRTEDRLKALRGVLLTAAFLHPFLFFFFFWETIFSSLKCHHGGLIYCASILKWVVYLCRSD